MDLLPILTLLFGLLLGVVATALWQRRSGTTAMAALTQRGADHAVLRESLDRLHDHLRDLDQDRATWQGQLRQQVDDVRHGTDLLRRETSALTTALRKPQVRGQWGELHLRRSVELAGMLDHCDFSEQVHLSSGDGVQRPDLVVHLAGGRSLVVDAKVPLDAFLDAASTDDPDEERTHLTRHARQLRGHVDTLSAKSYWRSLPGTPEFVVLFVPAEAFLSAALETSPDLLEYAAGRDVVLATPTTLIALLRSVAHGWTTQQLAERTQEVHELGRSLHERLGVMGAHLDKLGRSLKASVEAFNSTVGSVESRVLVTARRFEDLGVTRSRLDPLEGVDQAPRPLTAPELIEATTPRREGLPDDLWPRSDGSGDTGESRRSSA